jgi:small subunit ribosomal protein S9
MEILARAVGRRKEAVAQVQIIRGTGNFTINNKPAEDYLQNNSCTMLSVKGPFEILNEVANASQVVSESNTNSNAKLATFGEIDTIVKVKGGGLIGQAEAIKLGISRAVSLLESSKVENAATSQSNSEENVSLQLRKQLKSKGYLTQDSRVKERRKYGLKKARKASQYHKR